MKARGFVSTRTLAHLTVIKILVMACILLLASTGALAAGTKPGPATTAPQVQQAGRLVVLASPGDSLHHIDLAGFTSEPVIVCSPAQAIVAVACQGLTAVDGSIWIHSAYTGDVPVTVNWLAVGD